MNQESIDDDQLIFKDDSEYINDITTKLARIRHSLGIDQDPQTPPSINRIEQHNTFGKQLNSNKSQDSDVQLLQSSKKIENAIQVDDIEQFLTNRDNQMSKSYLIHKPQQVVDSASHLQDQIGYLQQQLEVLRQFQPQGNESRPEAVSFLERENVYLKIELELKSKQERYAKLQLHQLEEVTTIEIQMLREEVEQLKEEHNNFIQASDLQADIKQYIIALETDIHMTRQELNLFTQRLSKEQQEKDYLQKQYNQVYQKAKQDMQKIFESAFSEMRYICQALSSELINENVEDKLKRQQRASTITKAYEDTLDEKFLLVEAIQFNCLFNLILGEESRGFREQNELFQQFTLI